MNCPKCSARLKWDEGAHCTRCMFEASTYKPPVEPPAVPEPTAMPEGWSFSPAIGGAFVSKREDGGHYALTLTLLRALLATQGLRIVTEADALVLEACSKANFCKDPDDEWVFDDCMLETPVAEAELARRAQQKDPHGRK